MDREVEGSLIVMLVVERLSGSCPKGVSAGIANVTFENLYNTPEGNIFLSRYFGELPSDQQLDSAFGKAIKAGLANRSRAGSKERTPVFSLTEKGRRTAENAASELTENTLIAIADAVLEDYYKKIARTRRRRPRPKR